MIKLKTLGFEQESSHKNLKQAVQVYEDITRRFPRFDELDTVYFNLALAYAQQNQLETAHQRYTYLIKNFPNSALVPDAVL